MLVFVILVFAILNVLKIQQPYTAQICKNEQVPYTEKSCQNVQVPYSDASCKNVDYAYSHVTNQCGRSFSPPWYFSTLYTVNCTITNLERKSGDFIVTYGLMVGNPKYAHSSVRTRYVQTDTINIGALLTQSVAFSVTDDWEPDDCICEVSPPQLQNCQNVNQYKSEQQCQFVTVYKTEQQCQDTVKYKTVSVWQSLMG